MRDVFEKYLTKDIAVPHETMDRFDTYHHLLEKWQKQINLMSGSEEIWHRHFLDSVQIKKSIPDYDSSIIDLGSGGGFPGLPLSILGYTNVTLVESDTKKTVFLKEVARQTFCAPIILNQRIEAVEKKCYDFVLSRACADLTRLLEYALPLVSHGTTCLFLKGKNYAMEIEEAKTKWSFDYNATASITNSDSAILSITNLNHRA